MAKDLDDFLEIEGVADEPEIVEQEPVTEPAAAEPTVPAEPEAPTTTEPETPDVPGDVEGLRRALQATRAERKDHKGRAERLEGELAAIKAQLEAAKTAPPPTAAAPPTTTAVVAAPRPMPNPIEDPQGYADWNAAKVAEAQWNGLLNITEESLRDKHGDEVVDKAVAKFQGMVAKDPALFRQFSSQRNPYKWMFAEVKRAEAAEKIGPDPEAYAATLRKQIRAELQAEMAGTVTQPAAAAQHPSIPASLGTARSAAPRAAPPGLNIPEDLSDILASGRRK